MNMKQYQLDDSAPRTAPGGDVDDLIFCADQTWSASQR